MSLQTESKDQAVGIKRKKGYEGFDFLGPSLVSHVCKYSPCWHLVRLYARMGLHRYNLLEGTSLQFRRVKKFNKTTHAAASAFFITLVAFDPDSESLLTFQTKVDEEKFGQLILTCYIACPRGASTQKGALESQYYARDSLPKCPLEDPFENGNSYYLVKESELKQHYDWIRLYLELAVAAAHRNKGRNIDLSDLKVVKVAIEAPEDVEPPNERWLNFMNAIVYIKYKDPCEGRVGSHDDRIAIVRRTFNDRIGCFIIDGLNQSSEIIPKNA